MNLIKHKDSQGNYYEFSELENSPTTIFIHGVGLDNTMWYPQKKYFHNHSVLFYDLLNHGQSSGGFKELNYEVYNDQLINLINLLNSSIARSSTLLESSKLKPPLASIPISFL